LVLFSQLINIKTRVGGINWQTVVTLEIASHHVGIPRREQQTYVENAACAVFATRKELRSQARKRKKDHSRQIIVSQCNYYRNLETGDATLQR
jgi:hypothetical protein